MPRRSARRAADESGAGDPTRSARESRRSDDVLVLPVPGGRNAPPKLDPGRSEQSLGPRAAVRVTGRQSGRCGLRPFRRRGPVLKALIIQRRKRQLCLPAKLGSPSAASVSCGRRIFLHRPQVRSRAFADGEGDEAPRNRLPRRVVGIGRSKRLHDREAVGPRLAGWRDRRHARSPCPRRSRAPCRSLAR